MLIILLLQIALPAEQGIEIELRLHCTCGIYYALNTDYRRTT